jgi:hypothetical protein
MVKLLFLFPVDDMVLSMSMFFAKYSIMMSMDPSHVHPHLGPFSVEMLPFLSFTLCKNVRLCCRLMEDLCQWPPDILDIILRVQLDLDSINQANIFSMLDRSFGPMIRDTIVHDKSRTIDDLHTYLFMEDSYNRERIDYTIKTLKQFESLRVLRLGKRPRDE